MRCGSLSRQERARRCCSVRSNPVGAQPRAAHGRGPKATPHGGRGRAQRHGRGPRRSTMPEMWAAAVGAPAAAAGCSKFSPFVPRCTATDDARPSPTSKSMDQHKFHALPLGPSGTPCCCWFVKEIRVSGYPFGFRVSAGFGFGHEFAPELEFGSGSGFKFGFRFWVPRHSTRTEPDPLPSLNVLPNKLFIFIKNIIDNTFIFILNIYSCTCNKDVFKK